MNAISSSCISSVGNLNTVFSNFQWGDEFAGFVHFGGEMIIVDEGAECDSGDENCYDSLEDVKIGKRNSSSHRRKLPSVPPPPSLSHLTSDDIGDTTGLIGDLPGRVS